MGDESDDGAMSAGEVRRGEALPARSRAQGHAIDLLVLGGVAGLGYGCAMIYTPLAWIVVSLCAMAAGVILIRRS